MAEVQVNFVVIAEGWDIEIGLEGFQGITILYELEVGACSAAQLQEFVIVIVARKGVEQGYVEGAVVESNAIRRLVVYNIDHRDIVECWVAEVCSLVPLDDIGYAGLHLRHGREEVEEELVFGFDARLGIKRSDVSSGEYAVFYVEVEGQADCFPLAALECEVVDGDVGKIAGAFGDGPLVVLIIVEPNADGSAFGREAVDSG